MRNITDTQKAAEVLRAGGFKFIRSSDTRRLSRLKDGLFEFRLNRGLDITQTKDTITHQLIEAAKSQHAILAIASATHEKAFEEEPMNQQMIQVRFTLEQKETVCRYCGKIYNPEKSSADLRGYCTQKCLKSIVKRLVPSSFSRLSVHEYYDVLGGAGQIGDVYEGGGYAKSDAQGFPQAEENVDPGLEVVKKVFDNMTFTMPVDQLREYAEDDARLTSAIMEQFPEPIPCPGHESSPEVSSDAFRTYMARLVEYYIESWEEDKEPMNGSVESLAVDFAKFIEALDGECSDGIDDAAALHQIIVPLLRAMDKAGILIDSASLECWRWHALQPQNCAHGKSVEERCEECVAEGKYTYAQPRTQNNS